MICLETGLSGIPLIHVGAREVLWAEAPSLTDSGLVPAHLTSTGPIEHEYNLKAEQRR